MALYYLGYLISDPSDDETAHMPIIMERSMADAAFSILCLIAEVGEMAFMQGEVMVRPVELTDDHAKQLRAAINAKEQERAEIGARADELAKEMNS